MDGTPGMKTILPSDRLCVHLLTGEGTERRPEGLKRPTEKPQDARVDVLDGT